jgi:hypothetical protein
MTTTTKALAVAWGAPTQRITRCCRAELIPAIRTTHGWQIDSEARPPWRDGPMICAWVAQQEQQECGSVR